MHGDDSRMKRNELVLQVQDTAKVIMPKSKLYMSVSTDDAS